MSSADDDAAFLQILLSRIGTRPLLEDVAFSLDAEDRSLQVSVDRDHFTDLVTYILEDLVGTGSDAVTMQVQEEDRHALITISGNVPTGVPAETPKKRSFLTGLCQRAGGTLTCTEDADTAPVCDLPGAGLTWNLCSRPAGPGKTHSLPPEENPAA